ncbi:acyl-CoA dehydrogenase family protein [Salinisphaera sp. T31B1]|uniref:acyl-CoA dehydrogenase family protein n=1 Tax=Salinisphaera sp. T31B1 TaxID=727963 RepID=UPI0033412986
MNDDIRDMVLDTAARLFSDRVDRDLWQASEAGGFSEDAWSAVTDMGLASMLLSEAQGGTGLDAADGLALAELAGYHALPLPLAESFVGLMLLAGARDLEGDEVVALAGAHNLDDVTLDRRNDGWVCRGRLHRVAWGRHARYVLLDLPGDDGMTRRVTIAADRVSWQQGTSLAGEARDSAELDALAILDDDVRQLPASHLGITEWGALIRSLQMAGAMRRALELSVEHANERKQFGRPIAKFQAIQQQLAAMAGQVATAGAAAAAASRAVDGDNAAFMISVAKARVSEAACATTAIAHQVHAAMGFTREHTLHYYTRRLWSWRDEFGAEPYWQKQVGERACEAGRDGLWPFLSAL